MVVVTVWDRGPSQWNGWIVITSVTLHPHRFPISG